jgi:hypothetical protein
MQERHDRRSQQNQRWSDRHQQKVLHHMESEQLIVKRVYRRSDREPERRHPTDEGGKLRNRNHVREGFPKMKPSAQVDTRYQQQCERNRQWQGPRIEGGFNSN